MRLLAAALALLPGLAEAADPPQPVACPPGLPSGLTCLRGRDDNGSYVLLARPADWNGGLVTNVYGGPRLSRPAVDVTDEDLLRFSEFVAEGWAWVSSSRRHAGFGVSDGAEDALASTRMAIAAFGRPTVSVIHGQSWGGGVSAKAIETLNAPDAQGHRPWNAALLTAAVLAGPSRAYDMRVDLRAAFQVVCGTMPRPDETQYPVTLGLPRGVTMTREDLMSRYLACTGADLAPEARTAMQRTALADLSAASRISEWAIPGHLNWATGVFADIAWRMMDGRSAFGNAHVRYSGTSDDAAFNARVPRITPDPVAAARLAADGDLSGAIGIPVLTMHAIGDSTAFVEHAAAYRATVTAAGNAALLQQVFVDEDAHLKMSAPLYPAALGALRDWAESRRRPSVGEVRGRCEALRRQFPGDCRIVPGYVPQEWTQRVNPR